MKNVLRGVVPALFLAGIMPCAAFAYDAAALVGADVYAEVKAKGQIEKSYYKQGDVKLTLTPDTDLARQAAAFWSNADKPVFISEHLYLIPKAELGSGDPSKTTIDYASKVIRSVSKMEGMKYYSRSDKKWETLYKQCYCIAGPKDRTRVPDDTEGSADGKVIYCMQNDHSFGKTNYRLEYHQNAQEVSAGFANTTGLFVGPIKGIDNDNLRISLVIIDCGEDMMIYMLVQAKFPALAVLEKSMNDSFGSRVEAVYKWFIAQF